MKEKMISKNFKEVTMRLSISRFFILCGLFFPSLASAITPAAQLTNDRLFAYAEANYRGLFWGNHYNHAHYKNGNRSDEEGHYQQYQYRYYRFSDNYLGIDPEGDIFLLGQDTGNVLTNVGNVADYADAITEWESTQSIDEHLVFAYAEDNFPSIFNSTHIVVEGEADNRSPYYHRYYTASDNTLSIDKTGEIYISGPYTNGILTDVGNVADYRSAILAWKSKPSLKFDYPGFTIWLDCAKRGATKFQYVAQRDTGNAPRYDSFFLDPNVPAECQQTSPSAYGMDYDRGHLVPANHLDASAEAIKATNTMTNILPQAANMNRGAWLQTEEIIECYRDIDELLVIGGVIWDFPVNDNFLQSHSILTPSAFWKVIIRGTGQNEQAIAWIIPNSQEATRDRLDQYLVTVYELQSKTGEFIPVAEYAKGGKPDQSWMIPLGCDKS
jgi:endonuclease G